MSFSQFDLHPSILKALQACGYKEPTPIQIQSIPTILEGRDLVASAQTGTGKTAAFVLPALQRLCGKKSGKNPKILILTPTRELAEQITKAAGKYGKFLSLQMASLVGGMPYRQQLRNLSRPIDVVVATPGRLLDHMERGHINLSQVELLVLDEADRMLDMGFIDDVKTIAAETPSNRQTLLFSATIDRKINAVIKELLKQPAHINLTPAKVTPSSIQQQLYLADNPQHKMELLHHLLSQVGIYKAIIFTATKIKADQLANQLRKAGHSAAALHGDLKQGVRNRTLTQLRQGDLQLLVATDVAARGIDVLDISHVINFDIPRFAEDYVHRIGRTGRAGKSGQAISFVLPAEFRLLEKIERYVDKPMQRVTIEGLEPTQAIPRESNKKHKSKRPSRHRNSESFQRSHKKDRGDGHDRHQFDKSHRHSDRKNRHNDEYFQPQSDRSHRHSDERTHKTERRSHRHADRPRHSGEMNPKTERRSHYQDDRSSRHSSERNHKNEKRSHRHADRSHHSDEIGYKTERHFHRQSDRQSHYSDKKSNDGDRHSHHSTKKKHYDDKKNDGQRDRTSFGKNAGRSRITFARSDKPQKRRHRHSRGKDS